MGRVSTPLHALHMHSRQPGLRSAACNFSTDAPGSQPQLNISGETDPPRQRSSFLDLRGVGQEIKADGALMLCIVFRGNGDLWWQSGFTAAARLTIQMLYEVRISTVLNSRWSRRMFHHLVAGPGLRYAKLCHLNQA